jgi:hypothetical protein
MIYSAHGGREIRVSYIVVDTRRPVVLEFHAGALLSLQNSIIVSTLYFTIEVVLASKLQVSDFTVRA